MTVSDLLEQPCDKSDNAIKLVTSCEQLVPNLLQQLGTSSAKTTCRQLVNRFVTTCLQTCNNLCVFTCVLAVHAHAIIKCMTDFIHNISHSLIVKRLRPHCLFFQPWGPDTPDAIRQRDEIFRFSLLTDNFDPSLNFPNIYKCYNILSYLVYISFKICSHWLFY
jgi:hypothetical protein